MEERWEGPSKAAEFLGSAEEWHHVSSGRREREASLLHSLSLGVQRIKPRPSIQPIIKFIFSPRFVGLETCDKVRRLFLFPISKQNKNLGFSHVKSGNPDTSRYFVLSGRSAVVSDYAANFSQTKKIVNLPGSGCFFSTEVKKKKSGIPEKSGGGPSLVHFKNFIGTIR